MKPAVILDAWAWLLDQTSAAERAGLRALAGFECSGAMRRELEALGFDAWSCDLVPAEDGSNRHIIGDARDVLHWGWDLLIIMHPPCTFLCNSGAKHLYIDGRKENGRNEARWAQMEEAAALYRYVRDEGDVPCRAIENPVMHGAAKAAVGRGHTQFVHPYFFGDPFLKLTGFELVNLPDLKATDMLTKPAPGSDEHKAWSACHREPPGPNRAANRARTYRGIARAAASQWGAAAIAHKRGLTGNAQGDLFTGRKAA